MEIITDISNINIIPTAATIGSFDGVHKGHISMINEALALADERALPLTVVTFVRHPRILFSGSEKPFLLCSAHEKMALLEQAGVKRCLLLDFDSKMASLTAEEFMLQVLRGIGTSMLAVGYDHRFGKPKPGECFDSYVEYGKKMGIEVLKMSCFSAEGVNISSSKIRAALSLGDVPLAASLLGRKYTVVGSVVHGAALGRRLGFPTANIELCEPLQLLPLDGVYEVVFHVRRKQYKGVMNVGYKPTLNGAKRTVEVYALGLNSDIYDETAKVEFIRRLRDERRFAGIDDLRKQIETDVQRVVQGL